jgi:hypothetical protein
MNKNTSDANHRIIAFMANTIIVIMVNAMQQRSMDLHTEKRLLRARSGVVFEPQTCGSDEKVLQPPYPRTRYTSPFLPQSTAPSASAKVRVFGCKKYGIVRSDVLMFIKGNPQRFETSSCKQPSASPQAGDRLEFET